MILEYMSNFMSFRAVWIFIQLPIYIQTGFKMEEILRKYIRYVLNEKPLHPDMVMDLIHLRKASMLDDAQAAEVLNEVSRRIVRDKGTQESRLL